MVFHSKPGEQQCEKFDCLAGMVYPEREYDSWRQQQCASCKLLAGIKAWTAIAILCHRPLLYTFLKLLIADYPCSGPHLSLSSAELSFLTVRQSLQSNGRKLQLTVLINHCGILSLPCYLRMPWQLSGMRFEKFRVLGQCLST